MLKTGDSIGDWIVVSPLGEGGMGSVYKCRNALSQRIQAAVKIIKPHGLDAAERFVREAEALYALRHTAIVRVTGFGEDKERQLLWLAMELVDGEDLSKILEKGPLDPERARSLFHLYAEGLHHAHTRGIFHRDVKPANLTLNPEGSGVILDFGIAISSGRTKLTQNGLIPGTLPYMPPEVFEGDLAEPQKTDIYSLGLVLHEALTGKPAFVEDPTSSGSHQMVRMMSMKLNSKRLDLGDAFPVCLQNAVSMATEPNPKARLSTMQDFARLLNNENLADPPRKRSNTESQYSSEAAPSRLKWILGAFAALGFAGVAAIAIVFLLIISVALYSWNAATPLPQQNGFIALCSQGKSANTATAWHTIEAIKQASQSTDCTKALRQLESTGGVSLMGLEISDLTPLKNTAVTRLRLDNNRIHDITPLAKLTTLTALELNDNAISNLGPLQHLVGLKSLSLHQNKIRDVSIIGTLTELERLKLSGNQIQNVRPLATLQHLQDVQLADNPIQPQECPTSKDSNAPIRAFCAQTFPPKRPRRASTKQVSVPQQKNTKPVATTDKIKENLVHNTSAPPIEAKTLTKDDMEKVLNGHLSSLTQCHTQQLKINPTLGGDIGFVIRIENSGRVESVSVSNDTLESREAMNCMLSVLKRMEFPSHTANEAILYQKTLKFSSSVSIPVLPDCYASKNQSPNTVRSLLSWAEGYLKQAIASRRDRARQCAKAISLTNQAYCQDKSSLPMLTRVQTECYK